MDIIVFGGQSNMEGQTEGLPFPNEPAEGVLEYRFLSDSVIPLVHPVGEDMNPAIEGANDGFGSLLPDFCKTYRRESGHDVLAVHAAQGATRIDEWLPETDRYKVALKKILAAKKAAGDQLGRIYYVWLQGESDAIAHVPAQVYLERLIRYKDALKRDAGIDAFGIIRVGYFTAEHEYDEAVMTAQETACGSDSDFLMLTRITAEMSLNPAWINPAAAGHYNNRAMTRIGEAAGYALARYEKSRT